MSPRHLRILGDEELGSTVVMRRTLPAIESTLVAMRSGEVSSPNRTLIITDPGPPARQMLTGVAARSQRSIGMVKVTTLTPKNAARGIPLINGLVLALDLETGKVMFAIDGGSLTGLRTGALVGVAVRRLAASTIDSVAMIGAGVQARWSLLSLLETSLREFRIASRTRARADQVAEWFAHLCGPECCVRVCDSVAEAVKGADVVCTATSTDTDDPVVRSEWIGGSALLVAIGGANEQALEFEPHLLADSQAFVEELQPALEDAGEIRAALEGGHTRAELLVSIASVITGEADVDFARRRVFRSVGLAAEDLAGVEAVLQCFHADGSSIDEGDLDSA